MVNAGDDRSDAKRGARDNQSASSANPQPISAKARNPAVPNKFELAPRVGAHPCAVNALDMPTGYPRSGVDMRGRACMVGHNENRFHFDGPRAG